MTPWRPSDTLPTPEVEPRGRPPVRGVRRFHRVPWEDVGTRLAEGWRPCWLDHTLHGVTMEMP